MIRASTASKVDDDDDDDDDDDEVSGTGKDSIE